MSACAIRSQACWFANNTATLLGGAVEANMCTGFTLNGCARLSVTRALRCVCRWLSNIKNSPQSIAHPAGLLQVHVQRKPGAIGWSRGHA